jgi:hypothetical protein
MGQRVLWAEIDRERGRETYFGRISNRGLSKEPAMSERFWRILTSLSPFSCLNGCYNEIFTRD